ncbi:MAG: superkiller [Pycnora praestabilis]|nr:MAG: superkiller [Pycnora praestabilis]
MSKQYLTTHTIDNAHITDIFSLAVTPTQIISASGSSALKIHSTTEADFPQIQSLDGAHKLGCHHVVTSRNGKNAASVGFGGEVKVWSMDNDGPSGKWVLEGKIIGARLFDTLLEEEVVRPLLTTYLKDSNKAGELWAISLSTDGQYLASTTYDGWINVWDTVADRQKIREYETKGSFGMCIDLSVDGRFTASGHENGGVYIFNNETGRLLHSLPGLVKPVRAVAFSPGGKLLAAAGDSKVIALYDVSSGEQVANLTGHGSWVFSLDWSDTGEFLLSGAFDGKVKVWSIDQRVCVATHTETDKTLWSAKWLPKTGRSEGFAIAGANRSISFYREATGG